VEENTLTVKYVMRYLPDWHDFDYWATAPWPQWQEVTAGTSVLILESWLNRTVGSHYTAWAWHQVNQEYWEACVAFRWDKHRTLFLLTWA